MNKLTCNTCTSTFLEMNQDFFESSLSDQSVAALRTRVIHFIWPDFEVK